MNLSTSRRRTRVDLESALEGLVPSSSSSAPPTSAASASSTRTTPASRDPFQRGAGPEAIERIFRHMFESLHEPRFVVTQRMLQGARPSCAGTSCSRFGPFPLTGSPDHTWRHLAALRRAGPVELHRDYWDAGRGLYEKPLVGGLMRWLKNRVNS